MTARGLLSYLEGALVVARGLLSCRQGVLSVWQDVAMRFHGCSGRFLGNLFVYMYI